MFRFLSIKFTLRRQPMNSSVIDPILPRVEASVPEALMKNITAFAVGTKVILFALAHKCGHVVNTSEVSEVFQALLQEHEKMNMELKQQERSLFSLEACCKECSLRENTTITAISRDGAIICL